MHVVTTAGHVDHGKSALVRALTGQDPDRLPEERRRGLTVELGFCWTAMPVGDVAFVDVPGHERFVPTMLAGAGPVPVALLVVAADDPWMPQAAEHLAALDAFGVRHGVVAITRADLADPGPAAARARAEVDRTGLAGAPVVAVSARTGAGLDDLRAALTGVLAAVPTPDPGADVRLWVDRAFTVRGAGTVVTGTLPAGRVAPGDELDHAAGRVRVRSVQSLGREVAAAVGTARVALNLAGPAPARGDVLGTPGAWELTTVVDVRVDDGTRHPARRDTGPATAGAGAAGRPPERPLLHVGSAAVAVHHRPLAPGLSRLTLPAALPLRVGDRLVLRDPGSRALWGALVLDPVPPPLGRRGAAARRAEELAGADGRPDPAGEVRRRGVVGLALLRRIGAAPADPGAVGVVAGDLLLSADRARTAAADAERAVHEHDAAHPLDPGLPPGALADAVGLPEAALRAVLRPPLTLAAGRVRAGSPGGLPPAVVAALRALDAELAAEPFAAPTADRLIELALDDRTLAAAARAGLVLRPAPGIVLHPDAERRAVDALAGLPQPFTASEARRCLGTSRRVVLPLLDHLDRRGLTRRLPDDRRELTAGG